MEPDHNICDPGQGAAGKATKLGNDVEELRKDTEAVYRSLRDLVARRRAQMPERSRSKPAPQFHPFPKLPVEIRVEIWRLSLPAPRVVPIYPTKTYDTPTSPVNVSVLLRRPNLAMLGVCREARQVMQRTYPRQDLGCSTNIGSQIEPEQDNIYITSSNGYSASLSSEEFEAILDELRKRHIISSIKNLTMDRNTWHSLRFTATRIHQNFSMLSQLTLVICDQYHSGFCGSARAAPEDKYQLRALDLGDSILKREVEALKSDFKELGSREDLKEKRWQIPKVSIRTMCKLENYGPITRDYIARRDLPH